MPLACILKLNSAFIAQIFQPNLGHYLRVVCVCVCVCERASERERDVLLVTVERVYGTLETRLQTVMSGT